MGDANLKAYNPYDQVPVSVGGRKTYGRPIEFDSEVADKRHMKNKHGAYVKPSRIITSCPKCGLPIDVSISLGEPPFAPVELYCSKCDPVLPPLDPFVEPVESGRVQETELDKNVLDLSVKLAEAEGSVADRVVIELDENVEIVEPDGAVTDEAWFEKDEELINMLDDRKEYVITKTNKKRPNSYISKIRNMEGVSVEDLGGGVIKVRASEEDYATILSMVESFCEVKECSE